MFQKTSPLSILSGLLLAAACAGSALAESRDGGVELVTSAAADAGNTADAAPARLTITGLDRSFRTHVELARGAGNTSVHVALPAGLYAVDAVSSLGQGDVVPALSAPKLIVVAEGRVTTVTVSVNVGVGAERPADAELAGLER